MPKHTYDGQTLPKPIAVLIVVKYRIKKKKYRYYKFFFLKRGHLKIYRRQNYDFLPLENSKVKNDYIC